jgi:hypothetical protein
MSSREDTGRIKRARAWVPHPELEHIHNDTYACSYCMRVDTEEVLLESMRRNGIDDGVRAGD